MVLWMSHIGHINIFMLIKDFLVPDELVNMISEQGFHCDSPNLQDSFNMALSWKVLQMRYIGQHLYAR